jgi:hypothetical protein
MVIANSDQCIEPHLLNNSDGYLLCGMASNRTMGYITNMFETTANAYGQKSVYLKTGTSYNHSLLAGFYFRSEYSDGWTNTINIYGNTNVASAISLDSDENLKHDILKLPPKYELFFDNLSPVIYKYNNGSSNRFHSGFIAQSVKIALDIAELTL